MAALINARHELFAQERARGATADEAYAKAGYKPDRGHASRLAANGSILARIDELLEVRNEQAEMKIGEALAFLASAIRTPVGEVDETSTLAQEVTYDQTEQGSRKKVKMVGKTDALKLMADWLGWSKAKQLEVTGPGPIKVTIGA